MNRTTRSLLKASMIVPLALSVAALSQSVTAEQPTMVELPIEGPLYMRETDQGASVIVSADGRFVLPGRLIDRDRDHAVVLSVDDATKAYAAHSSRPKEPSRSENARQQLSLDSEQLLSFTVGEVAEGREEVYVWIDPTCPHCHTLLQMQPELTDDYVFHNLLIPLLGPRADDLVERLACAPGEDRAHAVLTRATEIADNGACDFDQLQANQRLARSLGVDAVPVVITPDRRMASGAPQTVEALVEFLKGH